MIEFTVLGKPQPAGSKRAFQNKHTGRIVVVDDAKGSRPWKQEVAGAAAERMNGSGELLDGPLEVRLIFHVARPKGHYGTGKNAGKVKGSAPEFPAVKPDVDKLSRAVLDALSGVVYRDDAQIFRKAVAKLYGTPERVEIMVMPVGATGGGHCGDA